jgi:mannose/fructose/N-acetylgalactosamine-specific phosphotransferase system component IIC
LGNDRGLLSVLNPILAASTLGGVLAVDNRSSLGLMISQPICGGLLTGLALGAPSEGMAAGALFQMLFLGFVPLRGERMADLPLGGVTAAALYIIAGRDTGGSPVDSGLVLFWSLFAAFMISALSRIGYELWERRSWSLSVAAMRFVDQGRLGSASAVHLSALLLHFIFGFLLLAVFLPVGRAFIAALLTRVGGESTGSLQLLYLMIPFIGLGHLVRMQLVKARAFWFGSGFLVFYVFFLVRG